MCAQAWFCIACKPGLSSVRVYALVHTVCPLLKAARTTSRRTRASGGYSTYRRGRFCKIRRINPILRGCARCSRCWEASEPRGGWTRLSQDGSPTRGCPGHALRSSQAVAGQENLYTVACLWKEAHALAVARYRAALALALALARSLALIGRPRASRAVVWMWCVIGRAERAGEGLALPAVARLGPQARALLRSLDRQSLCAPLRESERAPQMPSIHIHTEPATGNE